jgi:hypothetical protein
MAGADYKLLARFRSLFEGVPYRHRDSTQGDWVASFLVDDMYGLGQSPKLKARVEDQSLVQNAQNKTVGKVHRRGDGTFGAVVPHEVQQQLADYVVSFAAVATVEIGTETKIMAKAMIKQIDRVGTDMINQAAEFKRHGNNPICVGIVGINRAPYYIGLEGERQWPTTGKASFRHPIQEADEAEKRIVARASAAFDELVILRFTATNDAPYKFSWADQHQTEREYGAALVRLCSIYERRF